jgi:hypothetical protein
MCYLIKGLVTVRHADITEKQGAKTLKAV